VKTTAWQGVQPSIPELGYSSATSTDSPPYSPHAALQGGTRVTECSDRWHVLHSSDWVTCLSHL
jgi:hypothetical protein